MSNTETVLFQLLAAQGRTVRAGQAAAAAHIDSGDQHVAAMCPTGVGKSALAVAVSVARKGGVIAVNSNGLVAQYVAEIPEWNKALGVTVASLVGRAHYWCPVSSPTLNGFSAEAKAHVVKTGTFIGSGVERSVYESHSVVPLSPVTDADEPLVKESPCKECGYRQANACPLWNARNAAGAADVVVTNSTVLGLSLGGMTDWAKAIARPVIVLDEADSSREMIASVLGCQFTVANVTTREEAMAEIYGEAASESDTKTARHARKFLFLKKELEAAGGEITVKREDGKMVLTVPADLVKAFADHNVVAMSATLSQRNVDDLGLAATIATFEGLDVSASTVTLLNDAPRWIWGKDGPPADWAKYVANELTVAFRDGGRTLGLFQANADMNAVIAALPADVRAAVQVYSSKTDRTTVVANYKANPDKVLLLGLVQGAGRGLNLPDELLRKVIVSRVPENAPKDDDRAVWLEDSRAAITQSVGRVHRTAEDWGNVRIVGGFGKRIDVRKALDDLGWNIS